MTESKHTPGPWFADLRAGCFAILQQTDKRTCLYGASDDAIVFQHGRGEESSPDAYRYLTDEQEANARLIAAAPKMLEVLEAVYDELRRGYADATETGYLDGPSMPAKIWTMIDAVIREAKGADQ